MSYDRLITELTSGVAPVRRRSVTREAAWLAGLGVAELGLFLGVGMMRADMADVIGLPAMWWKFAGLAALLAISILTAVSSFSPISTPRRGLVLTGAVAGLVVVAGLAIGLMQTDAGSLPARLMPEHGIRCAASIVVLSLPMLAMLSIFMRRGASVHAEGSALTVGLAAASWGAFVFAFCCPMTDPFYIVPWYAIGGGVVAGLARLALPRLAPL